jgi:phosphotransacetylase
MHKQTIDALILIARPDVFLKKGRQHGIPIAQDDYTIVNPEDCADYEGNCETYLGLMQRRGLTPDLARAITPTNTTAIGAVMVRRQMADSPICRAVCQYRWYLNYIRQLLGSETLHLIGALSLVILDSKPRSFIYDGEIHSDIALDAGLRERYFPNSRLLGEADVPVFVNTDAASGLRNILNMKAQRLEVGPILMGMSNRAHIVTTSITSGGS